MSRAYTGKTCRVVRNEWTQHFDEHPDELKPFPEQAFVSARSGANHLGAPDGTDDEDLGIHLSIKLHTLSVRSRESGNPGPNT